MTITATSLDLIRASVAEVERRGIRIVHGDYGVLYGELSGEWVVNEHRRPIGVSPLGAVALALQPRGGDGVGDPVRRALATTIAWVDGFGDGFDNEASGYYLGSFDRQMYLAGLEAGMEFRFELTTRCPTCLTRHFRSDACPLCAERGRRIEVAFHVERIVQLSHERPANETGNSNNERDGNT